jgi:hypothetical protein
MRSVIVRRMWFRYADWIASVRDRHTTCLMAKTIATPDQVQNHRLRPRPADSGSDAGGAGTQSPVIGGDHVPDRSRFLIAKIGFRQLQATCEGRY